MLGGSEVDVVTVDMPMANVDIAGRRFADNAISFEFGASWCGTHSPSSVRPGTVGTRISAGFFGRGYPLATAETRAGETPKLLEVFPHVALLRMLGVARRVPYKAGKTRKYWPGETLKCRKELLLGEWARILDALSRKIQDIVLEVPTPGSVESLAGLKPLENVIDAIICAWVRIEYLDRRAKPYGNHSAAIWVPE